MMILLSFQIFQDFKRSLAVFRNQHDCSSAVFPVHVLEATQAPKCPQTGPWWYRIVSLTSSFQNVGKMPLYRSQASPLFHLRKIESLPTPLRDFCKASPGQESSGFALRHPEGWKLITTRFFSWKIGEELTQNRSKYDMLKPQNALFRRFFPLLLLQSRAAAPKVTDTPRPFSPQPLSAEGSDQRRSHSKPLSGTTVGLKMFGHHFWSQSWFASWKNGDRFASANWFLKKKANNSDETSVESSIFGQIPEFSEPASFDTPKRTKWFFRGPLQLSDLIQRLQVRGNATMNAQDLLIHQRAHGHDVEHFAKGLPQVYTWVEAHENMFEHCRIAHNGLQIFQKITNK